MVILVGESPSPIGSSILHAMFYLMLTRPLHDSVTLVAFATFTSEGSSSFMIPSYGTTLADYILKVKAVSVYVTFKVVMI